MPHAPEQTISPRTSNTIERSIKLVPQNVTSQQVKAAALRPTLNSRGIFTKRSVVGGVNLTECIEEADKSNMSYKPDFKGRRKYNPNAFSIKKLGRVETDAKR